MPTNLPPEYYRIEAEYRAETSPEEKAALLEEMLRVIPKHKGTDHRSSHCSWWSTSGTTRPWTTSGRLWSSWRAARGRWRRSRPSQAATWISLGAPCLIVCTSCESTPSRRARTRTGAPFVLKQGGTVEDFAAKVHRDFLEHLKWARVWGQGVHDGQLVGRDHVLYDGDVVEL